MADTKISALPAATAATASAVPCAQGGATRKIAFTGAGAAVAEAADAAAQRTVLGLGTAATTAASAYATAAQGVKADSALQDPSVFDAAGSAAGAQSAAETTAANALAAKKLDELAAPTDVTTLNATTSAHGLLPKGDGNTGHFLRGDLAWATPAGGGGSSWTRITADHTAVAGEMLAVDYTGAIAGYVITFPASPTIGDTIWLQDSINAFTVRPTTLMSGGTEEFYLDNADKGTSFDITTAGALVVITFGAVYWIVTVYPSTFSFANGSVRGTTQAAADNSTKFSTTEYVDSVATSVLRPNATANGTYPLFNDGVTSGQATGFTVLNGLITAVSVIP